jgi:very-short-patch-repair endonuclease
MQGTKYHPKLSMKEIAEVLRKNPTDAELLLWQHLKKYNGNGLEFQYQKTIGHCIVDFYCSKINLIIKVDNNYHFEKSIVEKDNNRDEALSQLGMKVIRFKNDELLGNLSGVLDRINQSIFKLMEGK